MIDETGDGDRGSYTFGDDPCHFEVAFVVLRTDSDTVADLDRRRRLDRLSVQPDVTAPTCGGSE